MNFLVAAHILFVALGLGGAASLYASANVEGRWQAERVTWVGLLGALVTGPVYGLSNPARLDTVIIVKTVLALALAFSMYRISGTLDDMARGRRSTVLLGILAAWVVAFLLGIEAAHP
ncbi:MAG: hypothetical protein MAG715_00447 [Methanonatronarchaeales archaeon]|nr:hypothetical protein [Methanonatronarchaeales archaeon]